MNTLSPEDVRYYYDTFRLLLEYSNRRFHVDDDVDFIHDEFLDPDLCKRAADLVWENPAIIDDFLRDADLPEDRRALISSWKNCIHDTFIVERHLKSGSMFIGPGNKVYQVLGLSDSLEDLFYDFPHPTMVRATLLPFRDVIITDSLYEVLPVYPGPGIKSEMKEIYTEAKKNNRIIRQLPETK